MTLDETKAAHAAQIAEICKAMHPSMTPGQIQEVQRRCASAVTDWQIAPLSRTLNEFAVEGFLKTDPSLTREAPTAAATLAKKLERHALEMDIKVEEIPSAKQIELAREVEAMSDDERLAYVPQSDDKPETPVKSHVAELEARNTPAKALTQEEQEVKDDRYLERTFGSNYLHDPFKRAELLKHRDEMNAPTDGQRADAAYLDRSQIRHGSAPDFDSLSGVEMISRMRAAQNVQGR